MYFPAGSFYLRAASWNHEEREMMTRATRRLVGLRSHDHDLETFLNRNREILETELHVLEFLSDDAAFKQHAEQARLFWSDLLAQRQMVMRLTRELTRLKTSKGDLADSFFILGRSLRLDLRSFLILIVEESKDPEAAKKLVEAYLDVFATEGVALADARNLLMDQFAQIVVSRPDQQGDDIAKLMRLAPIRSGNHWRYFETPDFDAGPPGPKTNLRPCLPGRFRLNMQKLRKPNGEKATGTGLNWLFPMKQSAAPNQRL
jgi:hypothetical protein